MEELISTEDMTIIDENSSYLGIPTLILMENAGRGIAHVLQSKVDTKDKDIVIFAGLGNNGGDSFVFARHICKDCKKVHLLLIGDQVKIRTDNAKINWNAVQKMDFSIEKSIIRDSSDLKPYLDMRADIIIDGLLGTGIRGKIREPVASAIDLINKLNGFKVAVDVPSGMNPDTGAIADIAVKADLTVTFHKTKQGLVKNKKLTGEIVPVDNCGNWCAN